MYLRLGFGQANIFGLVRCSPVALIDMFFFALSLRDESPPEADSIGLRMRRVVVKAFLLAAVGACLLILLEVSRVNEEVILIGFAVWIPVVILIVSTEKLKLGNSKSEKREAPPRDPYASKIRKRALFILCLTGFALLFLMVLLFSLSVFVILGTAIGIGLMCLYIGWTWNDKMAKIPSAVSQRSKCVSASMEDVCAAVPQAAARAKWSLAEAESRAGHFRIEIGMSLKTYGQTMLVNVTKMDEFSTNVDVRCEAHLQTIDWGSNDAAIEKFYHNLEQFLTTPKTS